MHNCGCVAPQHFDIYRVVSLNSNISEEKSFDFAVRIVNLYKYFISEYKEYVLSKQLLRCGTSIGANIAEA